MNMLDRDVITRREAHAKGLKRFYTGEPCKRGHDSERFTSSGACIACQVFTTPNKRNGPRGTNVGWPSRGLVCNIPGVEPHELTAAFLFIEHMGWLDAAVLEIRKGGPELLKRFTPLLTVKEQAKLQNQLEADRVARRAISGE